MSGAQSALAGLAGPLGWVARSWRRPHVLASLRAAQLDAAVANVFYTRLAGHAIAFATDRPPRVIPSARFRAAIAATQGQPKVLFASHTGNWEAALVGVGQQLPLSAIVKRQSQPWADRLATRRRRGIELLPAEGGLPAALEALRRGRSVVSLGDQAPRRQRGAVRDAFLGQPCWTDKSPAVLAARARCPLWVVAQHEDAGCTHVELLGTLHPTATTVAASTRAATALLDAFVRAHPADWLWLHRRWKDVPR